MSTAQDDERGEASPPTETESERRISMTCIFSGGVLGLATYDDYLDEIKAFQGWEDHQGPNAFQVLKLALLHVAPNVVFVSNNAPREMIQTLREAPCLPDVRPPEVRREQNEIFQSDTGFGLVKHLCVAEMPSSLREGDRLHWIHARLNPSATQQTRAVGALLHVLQREGKELKVQDISEMRLDGYLMVDAMTLHGLQIFQEDAHPSILGIGKPKEGFSVFGMMDRCFTLAVALLQSIYREPLLNLEVIDDRLNTIESLLQHSEILHVLRGPLKHVTLTIFSSFNSWHHGQIKDIPSILKGLHCHQAPNKIQLLRQLRSSIASILQLAKLVQDFGSGSIYQFSDDSEDWSIAWSERLIVKKFATHVTEDLQQCGQLICSVIDFDSEDENVYIACNVCPDLDRLKSIYNQLPEMLTKAVEKELQRIPRCLRRGLTHHVWSIVYVPQVGYLVQVLGTPLGAEILDVLEDYEQAFESTSDDGSLVCYYTSQCTDGFNTQFGDLLHKIQDMESSLCAELICRLMDYKPVLIRSTCVCAELDCLISMATCAHEGNYCRPTVSESEDLIIEQGRHPLAEMVVDAFIPNDTELTSSNGCIQVITGPNASGKSSYMKQVALIVFLSHIGSFVPAQSCHVGLTDRIFSRICTAEHTRISRVNQSTFMVDLAQMHTMVKQATSRSLLVIDEFGKGTLTSDGVGLLVSLLEHWAGQGNSPKIIACTHFSEIFTTGLVERCPKIQYQTMQVMTQPQASENEQKHVLLYKLIPGYAAASYGIHCAQLCGMPEDVVSRAKEIVQCREMGRSLRKATSQRHFIKDSLCGKWISRLAGTETASKDSITELLGCVLEMIIDF